MDRVLNKIRAFRMKKGFSHAFMANQLNISTSSYQKIETHETKLNIATFYKIAKILELDVVNLLDVSEEKIERTEISPEIMESENNANIHKQYQKHIEEIETKYGLLLRDREELITVLKQMLEKITG